MTAAVLPLPRSGASAVTASDYGLSTGQKVAFLVMLAFIALAPLGLYPLFVMKVMCFALFACAFGLLIGFTGLLSFGHAAFFGMGAYIAGWTAKTFGLTPELAVLAAGLTGAVLGLLFGLVAIRRAGLQFAMITLALSQLVYFACVQAPFTHGEDGLQDIPRGSVFGLFSLASDTATYIFVAAVFLIGFLVIARIVHSPFGQILKSIRENEARAISLGVETDRYKLAAFVLSAAIAGVAGGTKAIAFGFATLVDVHFVASGEVVLMTLLGGISTLFGPVVGAVIIESLVHFLSRQGSWATVAQGLLFILCVLAFRKGFIGTLAARLKTRL